MLEREVDDDILVGRFRQLEDQANAVTYVVSQESSFITGIELIDGSGALASNYNTDMDKVKVDISA